MIGTCENRIQVRGIITDFIINTLVKLDIRFPAICRNRCVNVVITFSGSCIQGVARGRRAVDGFPQKVELAVTGVRWVWTGWLVITNTNTEELYYS